MEGRYISGGVLVDFFKFYNEIETECNKAMEFATSNIQTPEEFIRMRDLQCQYFALNNAIAILGWRIAYIVYSQASKRGEV